MGVWVYRELMIEWQILFDTINVGRPENLGFFQLPAPFSIFGAQQVTPTGAAKQDFARAGYFETFGY